MESVQKVRKKIKKESSEDNEIDLLCHFCDSQFKDEQQTKTHINRCKLNPNYKKENVICYYCEKSYKRKDTLAIHIKSSCPKIKKTNCEKFKFNSKEEFQIWKDEEEVRTMSYFSKRCGMQRSKDYYYCQHHGSDKPHRKKNEPDRLTSRRKTIGSIKKNIKCPSRIVLIKRSNFDYEVEYYSTHSHEISKDDIAHQPVTFTTNIFIQNQLVLNVPPKEILNKLQSDEILDKNSKKDRKLVRSARNSVTPKTIQLRKYKMKKKLLYFQDDSKVVDEMIKSLEKVDNIILYKPLDKDIQIGPSNMECSPNEIEDLYMIGIQTKAQRDLLIKGANKILIADTIQCKYMNVLTVMIVDDHSLAWPVGHFLSNSMSSKVIFYFVKTLKHNIVQQTGTDFPINCLLTNDKSFLIDGFRQGFDNNINHTILCQYHLNERIKRIIREYADDSQFTKLYEELKTIITTQNEEDFQHLYEFFLDKYEYDAKKFIDHFKLHYSFRIEQWAMCYRFYIRHGNINTVVHVESFHNRLKTLLSNYRIDNLVQTLIALNKINVSIRHRLENNLNFENENSNRRHNLSIEIPDNYIIQINHFLWKIKSETFSNTYYYIEKINEICCTMDCIDKCKISTCRNVCIHIYKCSCSDKFPLCKHIHKIHSKLLRGECKEQEVDFHYVYVTDETVRESSTEEMAYERIKNNLNQLFQRVENKSLPSYLLYSTDTILEQFVTIMNEDVKMKTEIHYSEDEECMEVS